MEKEIQVPEQASAPTSAAVSTILVAAAPQTGWKDILAEATKYTVLGIFTLYSMGFIIWHSFLGAYGVSSFPFLQAEYFSAALCYIIVTISLGLPPALLLHRLHAKLDPNSNAQTKPKSEAATDLIIFGWYALSSQLVRAMFPSSFVQGSNLALGLLIAVSIAFAAVLSRQIYLFAKVHQNRTLESYKRYEDFRKLDLGTYCIVAFALVTLFSTPDLNKWFLVYTTFIYSLFKYGYGYTTQRIWASPSPYLRIIGITLAFLVLATHLQMFGVSQFGKIPRQAGGGKPETAFVTLSQQRRDLPTLLHLPEVKNPIATNVIVGPIDILVRTEKDIIFLNHFELTNYTTTLSTNVTAVFSTNLSALVITNAGKSVATNVTTNIVATLKTNVVLTTNTIVSKPPRKMTAKQIRADLVDAVIFSSELPSP